MDLSVVVPVYNEAENIATLVGEIRAALQGRLTYEIVYVDDCSSDGTIAALKAAAAGHDDLRIVRHGSRSGQSTAVRTGVKAARAPWIATLDGDGQNDPADIPALWQAKEDRAGERVLIAGHRQKRQDVWSKRISSRIANGVRQRLLQDSTPDTGCGLKLFARDAFLEMPYFDHMHRFLAALMIRQGGRVVSVPVRHRPRLRGTSKYGVFDRLWVGITDLFGVMWLQRRSRIPSSVEEA
jgi:dolichol-phosphate mannosyltransferase